MYELKVSVTKVLGICTADPPMKPGDYFAVHDGTIRIPEGSYVCIWALHSLLPLITLKEREISEADEDEWLWRVHHAQCPDPNGRVIFKIDQVKKLVPQADQLGHSKNIEEIGISQSGEKLPGQPRDLRVVVEEIKSKCTSGLMPGDYFLLRSGRLTIPSGRHFCLYAIQAVLPFLAAKQRQLQDGDWLKDESHFICPDPAGNLILRIERTP
jgi:uncharacterized repeat protein (TIGR04076 family)